MKTNTHTVETVDANQNREVSLDSQTSSEGACNGPNSTPLRFGCEIRIKPYKLTRQTREEITSKLDELEEYEGAHSPFDIVDPQGEVAAVYLFQKGGQLHARGAYLTSVLRDPKDLYRFLQRSKQVKQITLITKHEN